MWIDPLKFEAGRQIFVDFIFAQDGKPFTEFWQSEYMRREELLYKQAIARAGHQALQLAQWADWLRTPGQILAVTRRVCEPNISGNLLTHQYGPASGEYQALYRIRDDQVSGIEAHLYTLLCAGTSEPESFGQRFDAFVNYLKENRLSCRWRFVSYLAFLLDSERYFPIPAEPFEQVMRFHGIDIHISGQVNWHTYATILDFAIELRRLLVLHVPQSLIDLHSYMWVLGKDTPVHVLVVRLISFLT
jgi:hypothetical protein